MRILVALSAFFTAKNGIQGSGSLPGSLVKEPLSAFHITSNPTPTSPLHHSQLQQLSTVGAAGVLRLARSVGAGVPSCPQQQKREQQDVDRPPTVSAQQQQLRLQQQCDTITTGRY